MRRSSRIRSVELRAVVAGAALTLGLVAHAASPERGRAIALDPERGDCAICHALPGGDARNQGTLGPPLLNLARRYDAAALRARIADPKALNPDTAMPAYGAADGLHRVPAAFAGRPILTRDEIDDLVAWLLEAAP